MLASKKHLTTLKTLRKLSGKHRKKYIKCCGKDFINCLSEIASNVLKGNVSLTPRQMRCLKKHKNTLRTLANRKSGLKLREKIVLQKGGFLGALIGPAIAAITGLIGGLINRNN